MMRRVAAPLLVTAAAAAAAGCAQPSPPPGGEPDRTPPRVIEVRPTMFDTLTALDEPVLIQFDERVSERLEGVQDWPEAVLVSPATGVPRVRAGRRSLEISLAGGWSAGQVYRVMVRPVFRDLFGNVRAEPIELVFSTGAPLSDAALAGFVTDRLTGRPVADARVRAVRRIDEVPYVAMSDTAGFFAMRFVPAGAYDVTAWQDQDRDLMVDVFEIQDSLGVAFGAADTAVVDLALLRPDSTPARLANAEPVDSLRIRLTFDDYFAPGPIDGQAVLHSLPDSARIGTGTLLHGSRLDSIRAAEAEAARAAATDTIVGDTLARDTAAADTAAIDPAVTDAAAGPPAPAEPLPSQELLLVTAAGLLRPDSAYVVTATGVTNISGLPGGSGTASFTMPPPPPPPADTIRTDSIPMDPVPDTVPPDTVPPDTVPPGFPPGGRR